ncbi:hypothetical protein H632_c3004p0, partial [Helicosporidium sp. ATCC 50920]
RLSPKELLVMLQRLGHVDRLHVFPAPVKARWERRFLALLFAVLARAADGAWADDVFLRVERTFCCGLQSRSPEVRRRFFAQYAARIPPALHERLAHVVQVQDWEFQAHTFWLRHGLALLLDAAHDRDPITLSYNSARVPPLFDFAASLAFALPHHGHHRRASRPPSTPGGGMPAAGGGEGARAEEGGEGRVKAEPMDEDDGREGSSGSRAAQEAAQEAAPGAAQGAAQGAAREAAQGATRETAQETARETAQAATRETAPSSNPSPSPPKRLEAEEDLPAEVSDLLRDALDFMREQSELTLGSLIDAVVEVVECDANAANALWSLLFPIVWTSLGKERQTALAKPMIQLLTREHHSRQAGMRPTVAQTLLEGVAMSQPQPKIPAEVMAYMGRHLHAWQVSVSVLESHVGLFPAEARCFDAVCSLYRFAGEEDMTCGLWQRRAACEDTRTALALEQQGYASLAQAAWLA